MARVSAHTTQPISIPHIKKAGKKKEEEKKKNKWKKKKKLNKKTHNKIKINTRTTEPNGRTGGRRVFFSFVQRHGHGHLFFLFVTAHRDVRFGFAKALLAARTRRHRSEVVGFTVRQAVQLAERG
jgi:hypothetical protein